MITRWKTLTFLFACSVAGGAVAGGASEHTLSAPAAAAAPAPEPDVTSDPVILCAGGPESALRVELVADKITTTARGEALELRLELGNRFGAGANVRYALELVDDRGRAVMPRSIAPIGRLEADGRSDHLLAIPAGLADGFYLARVTAVGRGGGKEAAEIVEAHLEVVDGAILPIDENDWLARSRANQDVTP